MSLSLNGKHMNASYDWMTKMGLPVTVQLASRHQNQDLGSFVNHIHKLIIHKASKHPSILSDRILNMKFTDVRDIA